MVTSTDGREPWLRAVWAASSDAMALSDPDGMVLDVNQAYCTLYGYEREEVLGKSFAVIFPEASRADAEARYREVFGAKAPLETIESAVLRKDGTERFVEVRASFIQEDERRTAMLSVIRDVTERRLASQRTEALAAALERERDHLRQEVTARESLDHDRERLLGELRAVLEASQSGMIMVGADLVVRFVNRRMGELFGLDVSAWAGHDKREQLGSVKRLTTDPEGFAQRLLYLYDHMEEEAVDEVRLVAPVPRVMVRHSGPVYGPDGGLIGRLENYLDVSAVRAASAERERILAAEREARAQTEVALAARDAFLATISHDLQNPLAAIKGHAQLLERQVARSGADTVPAERVLDAAGIIRTSADQMSAQVGELLDLARLQAGAPLQLDARPVDLVDLVRSVLDAHRETLAGRLVEFSASEPTLVGQWDPVRVRRVFSNLVTNAAKFSAEDAQIDVRVDREGGESGTGNAGNAGEAWAVVSVRDRGVGIPAKDLTLIFERFHRAGNVKETTAGTGLGLASVSHIVELHGGSVQVHSEQGRGSTFTVRLPL